jgi:hypothetical protein
MIDTHDHETLTALSNSISGGAGRDAAMIKFFGMIASSLCYG